jgi:hypothetical protein
MLSVDISISEKKVVSTFRVEIYVIRNAFSLYNSLKYEEGGRIFFRRINIDLKYYTMSEPS